MRRWVSTNPRYTAGVTIQLKVVCWGGWFKNFNAYWIYWNFLSIRDRFTCCSSTSCVFPLILHYCRAVPTTYRTTYICVYVFIYRVPGECIHCNISLENSVHCSLQFVVNYKLTAKLYYMLHLILELIISLINKSLRDFSIYFPVIFFSLATDAIELKTKENH